MVDADTRNCAALEAAICAGDSPRATSPLMAAIISSNSASPRSTPMRDADNPSSAIACALAAEYSHRHALEQRHRLSLHPLQHRGQDVSLGHAPSGGSPARPPLFGPRDTDLLRATSSATVEGDLPSSLAISLHDALRSSILWTVSRSCLVSLP